MSNFGCMALGLLVGVANAQNPAPPPQFEVASIKPTPSSGLDARWDPPLGGRFSVRNINLRSLIEIAWNVPTYQISGGPGWADSDKYDVSAKAPGADASLDQKRLMLQTLLEDRFRLAIHREPKEIPAYGLLAAKNGLKLAQSERPSCIPFDPNAPPPGEAARGRIPCGAFSMARGRVTGERIGIAQFASILSNLLRRPVIDETGFTGKFDVHLNYSPEATTAPEIASSDKTAPSIFTAIQEQLGLRLESRKSPVEILVIDHAEKPSEN
jgi:uncharacterized protein (TIGR03435 family)